MPAIRENLSSVLERISSAAKACGRDPKSVRLLAVSKTFPAEDIAEAMRCGQIEFGENRVQELETKVPVLPREIVWHLIGHLQSNKAARAAELAHWIHSVDSLKLAERIQKSASRKISVLLEMNLSGEESKSGLRGGCEALFPLIEKVLAMDKLELKGLMTMAECGAPETVIRGTFATLRESRDRAEREFGIRLPELSMGMSGDFESAVAEGSTIVRIGTSIFGHRD